jgi:hypothetical protein
MLLRLVNTKLLCPLVSLLQFVMDLGTHDDTLTQSSFGMAKLSLSATILLKQLRIQSEGFELMLPFRRCVAEPLDTTSPI